MAQHLELSRAIDAGGFGQLPGDCAPPGEGQDHDEAGHLPGRRDDHRDHGHRDPEIRAGQPTQSGIVQSLTQTRAGRNVHDSRVCVPALLERPQAATFEEKVYARAGGEEPAPGHACDDERYGHGEEVDTAEEAFPRDAPVQQRRQEESDGQAGGDKQQREDDRVPDISLEAEVAEQLLKVAEADERIIRLYGVPFADRYKSAPADESVDEHRHGDHGGYDQRERSDPLRRKTPEEM